MGNEGCSGYALELIEMKEVGREDGSGALEQEKSVSVASDDYTISVRDAKSNFLRSMSNFPPVSDVTSNEPARRTLIQLAVRPASLRLPTTILFGRPGKRVLPHLLGALALTGVLSPNGGGPQRAGVGVRILCSLGEDASRSQL